MSGIEDLLRDAYHEAAQSVSPERVRSAPVLPPAPRGRRSGAVRGRPRWRAFAPLAAAAAVAAVIGGVVAVPQLLRSTTPAPVVSAVPGAPPFVVVQPYYGGDPSRLVVQAAGTRHVEGSVAAPHGTSWESVAATGNSTTFVAAAGSRGSNCTARLYTLTLTASGKPAGLRPLNAPAISGQLTSLAASSDGRTIAYAAVHCSAPLTPATIAVAVGGTVRQWTVPDYALPTGVSLSADGSELGYAENGGSQLAHLHSAWILPTTSPPGSLLAHSRKVFAAGASTTEVSAVLSGDGKTMYIATESGRQPYPVTLAAYRSADGALLRTLHTWANAQGYPPGLTIGGSQLLIWAIYQPSTFQVDLASGSAKPFWVFTPAGEFPEDVAW